MRHHPKSNRLLHKTRIRADSRPGAAQEALRQQEELEPGFHPGVGVEFHHDDNIYLKIAFYLDPVTRDKIKRRIRKEGLAEEAGAHRAFAL